MCRYSKLIAKVSGQAYIRSGTPGSEVLKRGSSYRPDEARMLN